MHSASHRLTYHRSVQIHRGAVRTIAVGIIGLAATTADADRRLLEIGGGIAFDALGHYDVGKELGGDAVHDDLGPGTLGVYVTGSAWIAPRWSLGLEGTLSVGGLVKTDERYFGGRSTVGSTLTVSSKLVAGWRGLELGRFAGRVGADLGVERMSEATGAGSVHLDSLVAGPWLGVELGRFVLVQLRADLHVPVRAEISDQADGDPSGVFWSGGVRVAVQFGVGPKR